MKAAKWQAEAVAKTVKYGVVVFYDYQYQYDPSELYSMNLNAQPPEPQWLRNLLGDDFFMNVVWVGSDHPSSRGITDAVLLDLKGFTHLQILGLDGTQVTDAGLEYVKCLTQLRVLHLADTKVTNAGLLCLRDLHQLRVLDLDKTQVTDTGLENLKGLGQLGELWLCDTKLTGEAVKKLQQELPNCKITR